MKPEAALTLYPDGTARGGRDWLQTFGAWHRVTRRALELIDDPDTLYRHLSESAAARLEQILTDEWAHRLTDVTILVADDHADLFSRRQVIVLAECRALRLRHPNPMPELVLFPRCARLWGRFPRRGRAAA